MNALTERGESMSKTGRYVHGLQEDRAALGHAMRAATNRSIDELTEGEIKRMVWTARLWLRNHYDPYGLSEQLSITDDARAEIMRRAIEAEQTADYREGVNI